MAIFWVFWLLHPTPFPSRSLSSEGIHCRMRLRGSLPPTGLTLHSSVALQLNRFQLFSLIIPYDSPTRRHHLHSTDARHMCGKGLLTCHVKFAGFAHSVGQILNVAWSFLSMKQSPLCMVLLWSGLPLLLWFLSILPSPNISYVDSHPTLRAQPSVLSPCLCIAARTRNSYPFSAEFPLAFGAQLFYDKDIPLSWITFFFYIDVFWSVCYKLSEKWDLV